MKAVHSTVKPLGRRCRPKHIWRKGRCVGCGLWKLGTQQRIEFNFWRKVQKTRSCWIWLGCQNKEGRGSFLYHGQVTAAYKVAWVLMKDPVPKGLVLDHLCRNILCVNPGHLECVSQQENLKRSPFRKYCRKGHLLELTRRVWPSGRSGCGVCHEEYQKRLKERRSSN